MLSSTSSSIDLASEDLTEGAAYQMESLGAVPGQREEAFENGESTLSPPESLHEGREAVATEAERESESCVASSPSDSQLPQETISTNESHTDTLGGTAPAMSSHQTYANSYVESRPTDESHADTMVSTTAAMSSLQTYANSCVEPRPASEYYTDMMGGLSSQRHANDYNPETLGSTSATISHTYTNSSADGDQEEAKTQSYEAVQSVAALMPGTLSLSQGGAEQGTAIGTPAPHQWLAGTDSGNFETQEAAQASQEVPEREGSVSSVTTASVTTAIHVPVGEGLDHAPVLKSSSESLRQISLQLSGLVMGGEAAAEGTLDTTVSELEKRNTELAALLQQEREASQQQAQHSSHLKSQLEKVEAELAAVRGVLSSSTRGGGVWEVENLREQLQVHIQTIGILVAEKSELDSKLTHSDHALKRKAEEVNELEGRLSASRQRVREVEASLAEAASQRDNNSSLLETRLKELEASKVTSSRTNKLCDELRAAVDELTERLNVKTQDYDKLFSQLTDTKSQLAMANLNLQQLRDSIGEEAQTQLERVATEHTETKRKLEAAQAALTQASTDNSQMAAHYQHYTAQLAAQTQALQEQVTQLTSEKEEMAASLQETKSALEAATRQASQAKGEEPGQSRAEREHLTHTIATLQEEMCQLKEHNAALTNDNNQLSKLVDQLSINVEGLEMQVERNKTKEVDTSQLLAAMQSDKVAAARALTQNKQLKEQLEELQSGFIIMSNKKLELTEKLEKELHVKKSLNQEISALNEQVADLRQQAARKDHEITALRENSESLSSQLASPHIHSHMSPDMDQLTQENATLTEQIRELENKLKLSKVEIEDLQKQNAELHALITEYRGSPSEQEANQQGTTIPALDAESQRKLLGKVAMLTGAVSKLEAECNSLQMQLDCERDKYNKVLGESLAKEDLPEDVLTDESRDKTRDNELEKKLQDLEAAHMVLESRFNRSMKEVADLSDEKQQLEHVVQQLQLETESIGDYITIYQFQRGVMKQQARERELELSSLYHEREEMKQKLSTLQELVSNLEQEKGTGHEQVQKISRVFQHPPAVVNGIKPDEMREGLASTEAAEELHHPGLDQQQRGAAENGAGLSPPEQGTEAVSLLQEENQNTQNESSTTTTPTATNTKKSPTVQRILDLLNEMEATSQLEHCGLQKFHPCPLCSGKLITV